MSGSRRTSNPIQTRGEKKETGAYAPVSFLGVLDLKEDLVAASGVQPLPSASKAKALALCKAAYEICGSGEA